LKYFGSAVTDIGISKKTNQDSMCLKIANTKNHGQIAMVIVCDGMGGLDKGELASATLIRAFVNWFEKDLPAKLGVYSWRSLSNEWDKMLKSQNYMILEYGKATGTNLGTTVSAMLIIEDKYMIAHVGDSRVYEISDSVKQLTEDQTFCAREIKRGTMTPDEAKTHPKKSVLLQCVGASRTVAPDIIFGDILPNAVYILCSDGFRNVLTNEEIYECFNSVNAGSPEMMIRNSQYLIGLVKKRKEKDNISVAFIKCAE
jgi:serine/threonine protein phosphatase PrpC